MTHPFGEEIPSPENFEPLRPPQYWTVSPGVIMPDPTAAHNQPSVVYDPLVLLHMERAIFSGQELARWALLWTDDVPNGGFPKEVL